MAALEVSLLADAVHVGQEVELRLGKRAGQLGASPNVESSFFGVGFGIQGRVETAVRRGHFAQHELERILDHVAEVVAAGQQVGLRVDQGELRIVVKHLLEMRNGPKAIGAVAMKASADVVANSAGSHLFERADEHQFGLLFVALFCPLASGAIQQKDQVRGRGKFGPARVGRAVAEAAVVGIVLLGQGRKHGTGQTGVQLDRRLAGLLLQLLFDQGRQQIRVFPQTLRLFLPRLLNQFQHAGQPAAAVFVPRREVGAAHHRPAVGGEEHRQRPAAALWRADQPKIYVQGRHVDLVDIGPLFPVHLDANEMLVEHRGDLFIRERLALHHVAPIATGIADGEEDQLSFLFGLVQGFFAPGVPIDRIVGVQEKIRAGLVGQPIDVTLRWPLCRSSRAGGVFVSRRRRLHRPASEHDGKRQQEPEKRQDSKRRTSHVSIGDRTGLLRQSIKIVGSGG